MKPEGKITGDIKKFLDALKKNKHPIFFIKIHGSAFQRAGIPDWHVLYAGTPYYIEVKAPGKEATPLQEYIMKQIVFAGGTVAVVKSLIEFKNIFRFLLTTLP